MANESEDGFDRPIRIENEGQSNATSQPDTGKAANVALLVCSLLQLPIWGFVMSYGVLQEEYATHLQLQGSSSLTGAIGTTLNGVLYISLPILSTLFASHLYQWRRTATIAGLLISSGSLILSASSTAVWHLLVTQGILFGFGSALAYSPTTLYLDEWFIRRRSVALSVLLAVKNVVGTGTPFITPALVNSVGLQNTIRIWGVITAAGVLVVPLLRSRSGRNVTISRSRPQRRTPWKFLTHPTFYVFLLANIAFSSGYGLPQSYLPSYAKQILDQPPAGGSLMLALFNLPGIVSCIVVGMLGDGHALFGGYSLTPFTVTFLSAFGSALSVLLLWGLAAQSGLVGLAIFSAMYGFFASAYSSTWGGALREIEREAASHNEAVDTGVVYGLMNGGRGIGFVFGGVVGLKLLKDGAVRSSSGWGYGTQYGSVILYTGISAVVGGWSILWSLGPSFRRPLKSITSSMRSLVRSWMISHL